MMMIKRKMMKGRSELAHFQYLLVLLICMYIFVGGFAQYDVSVNCAVLGDLEKGYSFNVTEETEGMTQPTAWDWGIGVWSFLSGSWAFITMLFSGCTGVPWYIYVIVFVVPIVGIIIFIVSKLPGVGSG